MFLLFSEHLKLLWLWLVHSWRCCRASQQAHYYHHHHQPPSAATECCQPTSGLLSSAAAGIENEFFIDNILIKIKDYNERTNQIVLTADWSDLEPALPSWFVVLQEGEGGGGPRPGGRRRTIWPTDPSMFLPVLVLAESSAVSRHSATTARLAGRPATVPARLGSKHHHQHHQLHRQDHQHHQHIHHQHDIQRK